MSERQIKFRGKSLSTGEWVYGSLVENMERLHHVDPIENHCYIFNSYNRYDIAITSIGIDEYLVEVDPKTVGQYIGVKDKNEKEAYIGDICKSFFGDNIGVIEWHKQNPWIVLRYVDSRNGMYSFDHLSLEAFEIIGNLTDNPDLLTQ